MQAFSIDSQVKNTKHSFFTSLLIFILLAMPQATFAGSPVQANCKIHDGTCTLPLSGGSGAVIFDISPKPVKAMTDLVFKVRIDEPIPPAAPYIDLGMPGMKMGPNRVILKIADDGSYTGNGIIVRCPSGKTLWQATVTVPGAGTSEFIFNVLY